LGQRRPTTNATVIDRRYTEAARWDSTPYLRIEDEHEDDDEDEAEAGWKRRKKLKC
jgi:hypothetical protein